MGLKKKGNNGLDQVEAYIGAFESQGWSGEHSSAGRKGVW
jgi:hypothetical protein